MKLLELFLGIVFVITLVNMIVAAMTGRKKMQYISKFDRGTSILIMAGSSLGICAIEILIGNMWLIFFINFVILIVLYLMLI